MIEMFCLFLFSIVFRCPKTVENFCVHSRNGYYNNHIFHRVIKVGFLVWLSEEHFLAVIWQMSDLVKDIFFVVCRAS